MQGHKAMLGLVIGMGVLILAGTATLIGVVVHRLANGHHVQAVAQLGAQSGAQFGTESLAQSPAPGGPGGATMLLSEPAGTRIQSIGRQSDTVLCIALTGGGPDRVLVWDLAGNRRLTELALTQ